MSVFSAILAAIILVIITLNVREWIQAIREGREEERRQRQKIKFYK